MSCATCTEAGRRGYCAPLRCYCGHADCYAFASYVPLVALNVTPIDHKKRRNDWAQREESTWIDKL